MWKSEIEIWRMQHKIDTYTPNIPFFVETGQTRISGKSFRKVPIASGSTILFQFRIRSMVNGVSVLMFVKKNSYTICAIMCAMYTYIQFQTVNSSPLKAMIVTSLIPVWILFPKSFVPWNDNNNNNSSVSSVTSGQKQLSKWWYENGFVLFVYENGLNL